ncbi:MAG: glutamate--tRNA ligase, partial [Clostridia bacterium]|nr:glutamate--tRNA ligase [Clostridia bacterium]
YFRIEDTDKKREIKGSVESTIQTLHDFGIDYDEGVTLEGEKGAYGPYRQSERTHIYEAFAKKLVASGRAYPCFCEKAENFEEIEEKRADLLEETSTLQQVDPCRDLTLEQVENNLKNGKAFALRLRSLGNPDKTFEFVDTVKGKREIRENNKDIVLIKSNGLPVYAFAHAVDDHLMGTTLVVRGEEWWPSLASHLEVFDALGFKRLKYAHNPVICKLDDGAKRKLSKRKDPEADMRFFLEVGYPTTAIKEYLLNLANSNFEPWRKANPLAKIEEFPFSAKKITPSNPMFDFAKLNDISKTYISKLSAETVYEMASKWAKVYDHEFYTTLTKDPLYTTKVLNIDRDTPKPRKDIAKMQDTKSVWGYMFDEIFETLSYNLENTNIENLKEVCKNYLNIVNFTHTKDEWFNAIKEMSASLGYATDNKAYKANPEQFKGNVALVCEYIRIALTTQKDSPDLYSIISVLGEEKVKARLNKILKI